MCVFHKSHAVYMNSVKILRKKEKFQRMLVPQYIIYGATNAKKTVMDGKETENTNNAVCR